MRHTIQLNLKLTVIMAASSYERNRETFFSPSKAPDVRTNSMNIAINTKLISIKQQCGSLIIKLKKCVRLNRRNVRFRGSAVFRVCEQHYRRHREEFSVTVRVGGKREKFLLRFANIPDIDFFLPFFLSHRLVCPFSGCFPASPSVALFSFFFFFHFDLRKFR